MMLYPVLLLCGAVSLFFYVREKLRAYSLKAVFLKSLVSALFIAVAVCGVWRAAQRGSLRPLCPFVLLGLVCGLLGDIWLDLKYVFPEKDEPFTYAGFAVFGLGHVFYILGLLTSFGAPGRPAFVIAPLLLGAALGFGNAALEKPMGLRYGKLKPTVIAYGALLFSTVLLAGSLALSRGWAEGTLNLFLAGAVLFALSDLILSGTYFGVGKERPVDIILNYLSYYGGQFLIASSLLLLK